MRREAIEAALAQLVPGDLLVLQCDEASTAATVDHVHQWMGPGGPPRLSARAAKRKPISWKSHVSSPARPNLWCRHTAIEAIVACSDQSHMLTDLPGFEDRLRARSRTSARCGPTTRKASSRWRTCWKSPRCACRPRPAAPSPSAAPRPRSSRAPTVVVCSTGRRSRPSAFDLAEAPVQGGPRRHPVRLDDALHRLRELDEDVRPGPQHRLHRLCGGTRHPYRRLTQGSMVQFGWGSKQRTSRPPRPT